MLVICFLAFAPFSFLFQSGGIGICSVKDIVYQNRDVGDVHLPVFIHIRLVGVDVACSGDEISHQQSHVGDISHTIAIDIAYYGFRSVFQQSVHQVKTAIEPLSYTLWGVGVTFL